MSQKGRLRRIDAGLDWLENEGEYRRVKNKIKLLEMAQKFHDRVTADPAFAAKLRKEAPTFFDIMWQLSAGLRRPAPPPEPPPPMVAAAPPPKPEAAPLVQPILRDAPLHGAPQDEAVRVQANPHPEERPARPRLEGSERARPPPNMEIRPTRWRARGAPVDDEEDRPGTHGQCITDYDPLREEDDE